MSTLLEYFDEFFRLLRTMQPADIADILLVTFLVYKGIQLVRATSTARIAKAVVFLLLLAWATELLLPAWAAESPQGSGVCHPIRSHRLLPYLSAGAARTDHSGCTRCHSDSLHPAPVQTPQSFRQTSICPGGRLCICLLP